MRTLKRQPAERLTAVGVETKLDVESLFGTRKPSKHQQLIWATCDWAFLPQAWRQRLRKKFARKIKGPFDITLDGMNYRLYPAENYCDRVLFGRNQLPENPEHQALLPLIKPGMVFVDIGGNVGTYSVFAGTKAGNEITLLALEPHPRTFQKLRYNLAANGLPLTHVHNVGVGEERGTLSLWSDGGSNIGHTSMLKEGTSNPKVSHEVEVVPLIDLLKEAEIETIDLLKIDIEGFEDRALAPFLETADSMRLPRNILIEVAHQHLWAKDLMKMLAALGYVESFRTHENRIMTLNK